MIFAREHVAWNYSRFFVMEPGDIIITGTPPGVALRGLPARHVSGNDRCLISELYGAPTPC
jgi:2-keto-4-pentenoate hydratase/2-oxohepta-3-ene-1,7-dioic acid hydratase in catechol pathway